jgi:hypothetical protein
MKNNQTAARIPIRFISHIFSATKQQKFTTKLIQCGKPGGRRLVLVEHKGGCGGGSAAHADRGPAAGEAGFRVSLELAEVL